MFIHCTTPIIVHSQAGLSSPVNYNAWLSLLRVTLHITATSMTPLRSIVCLNLLDMTVTQDSCVRARPNMLHMLLRSHACHAHRRPLAAAYRLAQPLCCPRTATRAFLSGKLPILSVCAAGGVQFARSMRQYHLSSTACNHTIAAHQAQLQSAPWWSI